MALPAVVAGISLGSKLLGGLFGNREKKKKAEAERKAQQERFAADKDAFGRMSAASGVDERRRAAKLEGIQQLIRGASSGNFNLDPAILARIQEARPFTGTAPTMGADPAAGSGSALLSGLFGTTGQLADTAIAGMANRPKPTTPPFNPNTIPPFIRRQ